MIVTRKPTQTIPEQGGGRLPPVYPRPPTTFQGTTAVPLWDCKFSRAEDGPELTALSVGAKFNLHCEGATIPLWTVAPPLGFSKPEEEFSLSVLALKNAGPNSADLVVTGYKAGNHSGLVTIGEGPNQVQVRGLQWNIPTSVEAKEGQPPKPFPPFGPLTIQWPWWLWAGLAGFIIIVVAVVGLRIRRQLARKRLIEKIKALGSVLSPYAQLHKDLRALLRRYEGFTKADADHKPEEYLIKINESFRNYLSRQLLVPATEWSDVAIAREIRKRHKILYKNYGDEIYALLRELKRAQNSKRLSFTDCNQLHEMARKVAEKLERQREMKS